MGAPVWIAGSHTRELRQSAIALMISSRFMCLAGEGRGPSGVARRMALRASAIRGGYQ